MKENLETIYKEVREHGNLIFRTGFKFDTGYYEIFVYKFNNRRSDEGKSWIEERFIH